LLEFVRLTIACIPSLSFVAQINQLTRSKELLERENITHKQEIEGIKNSVTNYSSDLLKDLQVGGWTPTTTN
jgi:hypothetical protein